MLKYAVPLCLAGMISTVMLETNKIIVSAMCTPEEFANYVNGVIEIPLIGIITGSISAVILVDMTSYVQKGNMTMALDLFKKAAVKSAVILFPVMIFLLVSGKSFIVTLYSEKYLESVAPFYIYLFVLPVRIVIYGSALMALGQTRVILYRSILDLTINVILSILLVHLMGYLGAAVATILTLYIWTVPFNLYKIARGFNVSMFRTLPLEKLFRIIIICLSVVPLPIIYLLLFDHIYLIQLLITAVLYFVPLTVLLLRNRMLIIPIAYSKYVPGIIRDKILNND
jgi:O-antigen/teichoic acid export membrane protein